MNNWNHRVLRHHTEGEGDILIIHEVHYENGVPVSYTENGVPVLSENVKGLEWVLGKMAECLRKPILDAENFPNEWETPENE